MQPSAQCFDGTEMLYGDISPTRIFRSIRLLESHIFNEGLLSGTIPRVALDILYLFFLASFGYHDRVLGYQECSNAASLVECEC
jgi:hypothetical protein